MIRDKNEGCGICLELLNDDICDMQCNHKYHNKCLEEYNHDKCPLCIYIEELKIKKIKFNVDNNGRIIVDDNKRDFLIDVEMIYYQVTDEGPIRISVDEHIENIRSRYQNEYITEPVYRNHIECNDELMQQFRRRGRIEYVVDHT